MLVSYIATSCLSWYFRAVPLASNIILIFNIPVFIFHMTVISEEGSTVNPVEHWRLTTACLFHAMYSQEEPEVLVRRLDIPMWQSNDYMVEFLQYLYEEFDLRRPQQNVAMAME